MGFNLIFVFPFKLAGGRLTQHLSLSHHIQIFKYTFHFPKTTPGGYIFTNTVNISIFILPMFYRFIAKLNR